MRPDFKRFLLISHQNERIYQNKSMRSHQKAVPYWKMDEFSRFSGNLMKMNAFQGKRWAVTTKKIRSLLKNWRSVILTGFFAMLEGWRKLFPDPKDPKSLCTAPSLTYAVFSIIISQIIIYSVLFPMFTNVYDAVVMVPSNISRNIDGISGNPR